MNVPLPPQFDVRRGAALEATRDWKPKKAAMALRAAGLDSADGPTSLDAVADDFGVSRETVRRARNELLRAVDPSAPTRTAAESPATARALRRLLTMTGPLGWDEVLSAWARAGGKAPYLPLPADRAEMRAWLDQVGGLAMSAPVGVGTPSVWVPLPEQLDPVSRFLVETLRDQPGGVDRHVLFNLAEEAGLRSTTIATILSTHPAVTRVGRGMWALRGQRGTQPGLARAAEPRRKQRARPTSFTWRADGSLLIEFSVPRGPSPVVAVPRAVAAIVEGREFPASPVGAQRITVGNGKLWGFGPLLSGLGLRCGARAEIAFNLLDGTATISPAQGSSTE